MRAHIISYSKNVRKSVNLDLLLNNDVIGQYWFKKIQPVSRILEASSRTI